MLQNPTTSVIDILPGGYLSDFKVIDRQYEKPGAKFRSLRDTGRDITPLFCELDSLYLSSRESMVQGTTAFGIAYLVIFLASIPWSIRSNAYSDYCAETVC